MIQKPLESKPKDEIDPSEVDKRFDAYFQNLNQNNVKNIPEEAMKKTSNLDGLDLELSQSISNGFDAFKREQSEKKDVIEKNKLLDSLDLNVGMDALLQL